MNNTLPKDIWELILQFIIDNQTIFNLRIVNKLFNNLLTPCPVYYNNLLYQINYNKDIIIWTNVLNKTIYKEIIFGSYGNVKINVQDSIINPIYKLEPPNNIIKIEKHNQYYKKKKYNLINQTTQTSILSNYYGCTIM